MDNHAFYSYERELLSGAYVYRTPDGPRSTSGFPKARGSLEERDLPNEVGTLLKLTNIRSSNSILDTNEFYLGILPANSKYVSFNHGLDNPNLFGSIHSSELTEDPQVRSLANMFDHMSLETNEDHHVSIGTEDIWEHCVQQQQQQQQQQQCSLFNSFQKPKECSFSQQNMDLDCSVYTGPTYFS